MVLDSRQSAAYHRRGVRDHSPSKRESPSNEPPPNDRANLCKKQFSVKETVEESLLFSIAIRFSFFPLSSSLASQPSLESLLSPAQRVAQRLASSACACWRISKNARRQARTPSRHQQHKKRRSLVARVHFCLIKAVA